MKNEKRFEVTTLDVCSLTVARLIHSSADATRVFDLIRERFSCCADKTMEAINKLGGLLSCWDVQDSMDASARQSYWVEVAVYCEYVRTQLCKQCILRADQYMVTILLDALAQAVLAATPSNQEEAREQLDMQECSSPVIEETLS